MQVNHILSGSELPEYSIKHKWNSYKKNEQNATKYFAVTDRKAEGLEAQVLAVVINPCGR